MAGRAVSHQRAPGYAGAEKLIVRGAEATAALYALDHATKRTPIGGKGDFAAQAARTAATS